MCRRKGIPERSTHHPLSNEIRENCARIACDFGFGFSHVVNAPRFSQYACGILDEKCPREGKEERKVELESGIFSFIHLFLSSVKVEKDNQEKKRNFERTSSF